MGLGTLTEAIFMLERLRTWYWSVHKTGCFSSPNLVLEAQKILREPLVFLLCWKTKKARFWCQQWQNSSRVDAFTSKGGRYKTALLSPKTLMSGLLPEGTTRTGEELLLWVNHPRKYSNRAGISMSFSSTKIYSTGQPILTITVCEFCIFWNRWVFKILQTLPLSPQIIFSSFYLLKIQMNSLSREVVIGLCKSKRKHIMFPYLQSLCFLKSMASWGRCRSSLLKPGLQFLSTAAP